MPIFDRQGTELRPGDLFVAVFYNRPKIAGNRFNGLMMFVESHGDADQFAYYSFSDPGGAIRGTSIFHKNTYDVQVISRDIAKQGINAITLCLKLGGLEWMPEQQEYLSTNQKVIMENYEKQYCSLSSHSQRRSS